MDKRNGKFQNFKKGIVAALPLAMGYIAVAFTFGIAAQSVINPGHSVLMSATCLSSSGQFAALSLIMVSAPLWEVALAQFIINARYALMSCSISQKLDPEIKTGHRLIIALGITDEVFGIISEKQGRLNVNYLLGMVSVTVPSWVLGTLIGSLAQNFLPQVVVTSLGVAFYGMFIAVIIPPTKKNKLLLVLVCISMTASFAFDLTPILKNISPGIKIILLTLVITSIVAYYFPVKDSNSQKKNEKENEFNNERMELEWKKA